MSTVKTVWPLWSVYCSIVIALVAFPLAARCIMKTVKPVYPEVQICPDKKVPDGKLRLTGHHQYLDTVYLNDQQYSASAAALNSRTYKELRSRTFVNTHPFLFRWVLFHSALFALSIASLIPLGILILNLIRDHVTACRYWWLLVLGVGLALVAYIFGSLTSYTYFLHGGEIMDQFHILFENPQFTLGMITIPVISIGIIAAVAVILVSIGVYNNFKINAYAAEERNAAEIFYSLKDTLNLLTIFLAILVSASVIGTGLQRQMVVDELPGANFLYPQELVYGYGFLFSLLLFVLYAPSYLYLRQFMPPVEPPAVAPDAETKPKTPWLGMIEDTIANFKMAASIALPILISIIQGLFQTH